ncbi:chromosome segregation protein [Corynebacterium occultum]|uniref:Chromosome segregation protein n=1 Tax=Corynebacterium occultum TaxID=2675219 RepID=A0A6B8W839_9CORY|nr:AAA family ATPase [Corynebacterium occultum]QGU07056.1 chromosome segregation protein [Corynebacterium occultum]
MRIHELEIDNFRGIGHLELAEIPATGVIVIAGDNEQGKSTIMEAIDTVLNVKHRSTAQGVKAVQPVGQDVPSRVSLKLSVGEVTFRITKQFNRKKSATLDILSPRPANLTGDEAEDRLVQILQDNTDEQLLKTLFMRQGEVPAGIQAVGIPSLAQALDGQNENSGVEDTALTTGVNTEYLRYFTPKGKESGELARARAAADQAQTQLGDARLAVQALSTHVDGVARLSADRERATRDLPAARAELSARETGKIQAEQVKARVDAVREELERAVVEVDRAAAEQQRRQALREEVAALRLSHEQRSAGLEAATREAAQETQNLATLEEELRQARGSEDEATAALKKAREELQLLNREERRRELVELLAAVDGLDAELRDVGEEPLISEAQLKAVEEAATDLSVQEKLRESLAAKLHLSSAAGVRITVDDRELDIDEAGSILELSSATTLRIGEVVAEYTPGADSGADSVEAAARRLKQLLAEVDCEEVAEVRRRHEDSRRAADTTASLERERAGLLKQQEPDQLRRELESLQLALAEVELPDRDVTAATTAVAAAEEVLGEASRELRLVDSRIEPHRERKRHHALNLLQAEIDIAREGLERKEKELAEAEERQPEAELAGALAETERKRAEVAELKETAEQELLVADPDLAVQLCEGAKAKVSALEDTLARSTEELARLSGYIEQATGADERLEQAESAATATRRTLESVERRARAAELLKEVLERHQAKAQARYAEPFAEQLTILARAVFGPEVQFALDEKLQVTSRSIGEKAVPLEALSGGAKEQLAILTRFAIARLVGEQEGGTPVFVDDALGSTDPGRLDRMAALFSQAGRSTQVFVLTCMPQRYESVTGKREYRIEELKSRFSLVE